MRRIEEKMVYAVRNLKSWKESNTEVVVIDTENGKNVYVRLFFNTIFEASYVNGKGFVQRNFHLAGHNTATTRSRLNALGVNVCQRNFSPVYEGQKISAYRWYEVL